MTTPATTAALDGYARLGLSRNPFVAEAAPGVAEEVFLDVGVPALPDVAVVELVGCKGAGKTTHLVRWCRLLGGRYTHVPPGPRRLVPPPISPVAAWDEVDRLPPRILRRQVAAARRAGSQVLLGSHRVTGCAEVTITLPSPDAALVAAFFAARVEAATLPGHAPTLVLDPVTAAEVASASNGCWWTVGTTLHVHAARAAAGAG